MSKMKNTPEAAETAAEKTEATATAAEPTTETVTAEIASPAAQTWTVADTQPSLGDMVHVVCAAGHTLRTPDQGAFFSETEPTIVTVDMRVYRLISDGDLTVVIPHVQA